MPTFLAILLPFLLLISVGAATSLRVPLLTKVLLVSAGVLTLPLSFYLQLSWSWYWTLGGFVYLFLMAVVSGLLGEEINVFAECSGINTSPKPAPVFRDAGRPLWAVTDSDVLPIRPYDDMWAKEDWRQDFP